MAIEGNLKDLGLPNLIQTICLDQRNTLITLKHRQQSGVIACYGGQVVHAEVGNLKGEEAIYELLGWMDGSFRLADNIAQPPQSINQSWTALLMEGLRRVDEKRAAECAQQPSELTPADIEKDSVLESKLILLLSNLEQMHVRLAGKEAQKNIPLALQLIAEMVNQAAQFSERECDATELQFADKGGSLGGLLAEAASEFPLVSLLQVQRNRLSVAAVSKLHSVWAGNPQGRRENLSQIARAMLRVIEDYLAQFLAGFRSSKANAEYQEVVNIFLTDLTHVVDKLNF